MPSFYLQELDSSDDELVFPNNSFRQSISSPSFCSFARDTTSAGDMRIVDALIPRGFPALHLEDIFSNGIAVRIIGLTRKGALDHSIELSVLTRLVVNLICKDADSHFTSHVWMPWDETTACGQPFYHSLEIAQSFLEQDRAIARHKLPTVGFYCNSGDCTGTILTAYMLINYVMRRKDEGSFQQYFFQPRKIDVLVKVQLLGDSTNVSVYTSALIAHAIEAVKKLSTTPMFAVKYFNQIKILEDFEDRIARSFCQRFDKPFVGLSQKELPKVYPCFAEIVTEANIKEIYFKPPIIEASHKSITQTPVSRVKTALCLLKDFRVGAKPAANHQTEIGTQPAVRPS